MGVDNFFIFILRLLWDVAMVTDEFKGKKRKMTYATALTVAMISCRNLENFGPVTSEFTKLNCEIFATSRLKC